MYDLINATLFISRPTIEKLVIVQILRMNCIQTYTVAVLGMG